MLFYRARAAAAITVGVLCLASTRTANAQGIEVGLLGGYRFGGELFQDVAGRPLDIAGAPALGVVVGVPVWAGLHVEGLYTHQAADALIPSGYLGSLTRWRLTVDHWHGGGLQEFAGGAVPRLFTGTLGLTRYTAEADRGIRFSIGGGGGVKLFPVRAVALRLDGRVFTTLLDAGSTGFACVHGTCFIALNVDLAWQAEFTAALVVRLP